MRIAVVAVGTRGDVEPHAALCMGLRAAGYDARLCAPDDYASSWADRGIPFDPIPVRFRGLYETAAGHALVATGSNGVRFLRGIGATAVSVASQVIDGIRHACRQADAVCYSPLGIPALYFARELGIPAFATALQPLGRTGDHANPLLSLPDWTPSAINRFSYRLVEQVFWQVARPLLRPYLRGPSPFAGTTANSIADRTPPCSPTARLVVPPGSDWKPWMHATGYWTPQAEHWRPPGGLEDFLAAAPTVCIGFGSMHGRRIARILDIALDVLARDRRQVLILTGWSDDGRPAGRDGNLFVLRDAPHAWLFPRVSAVVHHGGAGTTAAALRAGVPSVILPFFFDQSFWGRRLAARGLGPPPIAFRSLSAATFSRALGAAEGSPDMRIRLRQISSQLGQEDGVGRAVAILARALEKK